MGERGGGWALRSRAPRACMQVSVVHGSSVADALLELPAPSTKSTAADFPAAVWLTIGLLATDGLALQVRGGPPSAPAAAMQALTPPRCPNHHSPASTKSMSM